jgi:hypothetical protein
MINSLICKRNAEMKDEDGAERVLTLNKGNMKQKVAEMQIVIGHHFGLSSRRSHMHRHGLINAYRNNFWLFD